MKAPGPTKDVSCLYCMYGLTPAVKALYERLGFDPDDDFFAYGPGHVVFADENYDDYNIKACIKGYEGCNDGLNRGLLVLRALLAIPESERTWDEE